jgi:hypothetical protein
MTRLVFSPIHGHLLELNPKETSPLDHAVPAGSTETQSEPNRQCAELRETPEGQTADPQTSNRDLLGSQSLLRFCSGAEISVVEDWDGVSSPPESHRIGPQK